jgi:hypothetical protein
VDPVPDPLPLRKSSNLVAELATLIYDSLLALVIIYTVYLIIIYSTLEQC